MPPTARKQPQDRKPKKADTDHANDTYMRMTIGDQEFVSSRPIRAAMKAGLMRRYALDQNDAFLTLRIMTNLFEDQPEALAAFDDLGDDQLQAIAPDLLDQIVLSQGATVGESSGSSI